MKVLNMHERDFPVDRRALGVRIDSPASPADALWPRETWPRIAFDRPLSVGNDASRPEGVR